ncbi:hypothetical protein ACFX1Q_010352 [Malus domestica]
MPNRFRPIIEMMRKMKRKKSSTLPEGFRAIATAPTETDLHPRECLQRFRAAYLMKKSEGCRRQLWCGTGLEKRKRTEDVGKLTFLPLKAVMRIPI